MRHGVNDAQIGQIGQIYGCHHTRGDLIQITEIIRVGGLGHVYRSMRTRHGRPVDSWPISEEAIRLSYRLLYDPSR